MQTMIAYSAVGVLTVILWVGAWEKLRNLWIFEAAVGDYDLLPHWLWRPFALMYPLLELSSGALLLVPQTRTAGVISTLLVLLLATGAISVNLLRGRAEIDCGCGGLSNSYSGLSWWLVTRNACLVALTLSILPIGPGPADQPFIINWLDGLSLLGFSMALIGLYAIFNQLMSSYLRMSAERP